MSSDKLRTKNLIFSAWLLHTRKLKFTGVEQPQGNSTNFSFVFEDPNDEKDALFTEFITGPFNSFYASLRTLRTLVESKKPHYYGASR